MKKVRITVMCRAEHTALMEKYARKAGYVYPAERVYINGN